MDASYLGQELPVHVDEAGVTVFDAGGDTEILYYSVTDPPRRRVWWPSEVTAGVGGGRIEVRVGRYTHEVSVDATYTGRRVRMRVDKADVTVVDAETGEPIPHRSLVTSWIQKVKKDGYVQVQRGDLKQNVWLSTRYAGQQVRVRVDGANIEVFADGARIRRKPLSVSARRPVVGAGGSGEGVGAGESAPAGQVGPVGGDAAGWGPDVGLLSWPSTVVAQPGSYPQPSGGGGFDVVRPDRGAGAGGHGADASGVSGAAGSSAAGSSRVVPVGVQEGAGGGGQQGRMRIDPAGGAGDAGGGERVDRRALAESDSQGFQLMEVFPNYYGKGGQVQLRTVDGVELHVPVDASYLGQELPVHVDEAGVTVFDAAGDAEIVYYSLTDPPGRGVWWSSEVTAGVGGGRIEVRVGRYTHEVSVDATYTGRRVRMRVDKADVTVVDADTGERIPHRSLATSWMLKVAPSGQMYVQRGDLNRVNVSMGKKYAGQQVRVRVDGANIEVFADGARIRRKPYPVSARRPVVGAGGSGEGVGAGESAAVAVPAPAGQVGPVGGDVVVGEVSLGPGGEAVRGGGAGSAMTGVVGDAAGWGPDVGLSSWPSTVVAQPGSYPQPSGGGGFDVVRPDRGAGAGGHGADASGVSGAAGSSAAGSSRVVPVGVQEAAGGRRSFQLIVDAGADGVAGVLDPWRRRDEHAAEPGGGVPRPVMPSAGPQPTTVAAPDVDGDPADQGPARVGPGAGGQRADVPVPGSWSVVEWGSGDGDPTVRRVGTVEPGVGSGGVFEEVAARWRASDGGVRRRVREVVLGRRPDGLVEDVGEVEGLVASVSAHSGVLEVARAWWALSPGEFAQARAWTDAWSQQPRDAVGAEEFRRVRMDELAGRESPAQVAVQRLNAFGRRGSAAGGLVQALITEGVARVRSVVDEGELLGGPVRQRRRIEPGGLPVAGQQGVPALSLEAGVGLGGDPVGVPSDVDGYAVPQRRGQAGGLVAGGAGQPFDGNGFGAGIGTTTAGLGGVVGEGLGWPVSSEIRSAAAGMSDEDLWEIFGPALPDLRGRSGSAVGSEAQVHPPAGYENNRYDGSHPRQAAVAGPAVGVQEAAGGGGQQGRMWIDPAGGAGDAGGGERVDRRALAESDSRGFRLMEVDTIGRGKKGYVHLEVNGVTYSVPVDASYLGQELPVHVDEAGVTVFDAGGDTEILYYSHVLGAGGRVVPGAGAAGARRRGGRHRVRRRRRHGDPLLLRD
ncbi:hypothetical protein [Mycolicibacterium arabiense]|uniref:hypothetical protein n=1 Tax=Mycolicibacterium arabiense TaxID=1286181 RepID=UPI0021F2DDD4|nr:hypothetical protein [Mycolicibacterium arabiense]